MGESSTNFEQTSLPQSTIERLRRIEKNLYRGEIDVHKFMDGQFLELLDNLISASSRARQEPGYSLKRYTG